MVALKPMKELGPLLAIFAQNPKAQKSPAGLGKAFLARDPLKFDSQNCTYLLIDKFTIVYLFFHSLFFVVTQSITEACRKHGAACTSSRRFRSNTPWRTSTTCSSSVITVALL